MLLAMFEHRGARSPQCHWQCPSTEEGRAPGVTGDVQALRSEEFSTLLVMSEHRGARSPDIAGDDRASRSEESLALLVMTEHRGARSSRCC